MIDNKKAATHFIEQFSHSHDCFFRYIRGVGLQYAGIGMINTIKQAHPTLKTWETETPCGGGRARDCGTGPGTRNNSWAWGESQWSTMRSFLEAGASVYSQWNMVRVRARWWL